MVATIDIESSPITSPLSKVKEVFCVALKIENHPTKCYTPTRKPYSDGTFKELRRLLLDIDIIVGHNIVKFDMPVLKHVLGLSLYDKVIFDTLLISRLMFNREALYAIDIGIKDMPKELLGRFSLKAFGYRLEDNKIDFEDFTKLTKEMVIYCKQDVDLTYKLYQHLKKMDTYPLRDVIQLEVDFAKAISKQEEFGFYFDIEKARKLATRLQFKSMNIEHKLWKMFPPIFVSEGVVTPKTSRKSKIYLEEKKTNPLRKQNLPLTRYKKPKRVINPITGEITTLRYKLYKGKFFTKPTKLIHSITIGEYEKIKLQKFNPASRQQCVARLKKLGWKPVAYTPTGTVQLNADAIDKSMETIC